MFHMCMVRLLALGLITSFVLASNLHAGIIYTVRFSDAPTSMQSGQTATLTVVLDETISGVDTFRLGSSDINSNLLGLTAANFQVDVTGTGASSITSAAGNATLFDIQGTVTSNPVTVSQTIFANNPATGSVSGSTRRVQLGTVNIVASGVAGQSNTFSLSDPGASDDFIIDSFFGSPNSLILDSGVLPGNTTFAFASSTIQITGVPEPSSLALIGLTATALIARSRRRRQAAGDEKRM